MDVSKRVSQWTVEEVLEWVQEQHPAYMNTLHKAVIKHDISGRALLRLKDRHLEILGVAAEEQQQEILQDLLLLRVQEEINELSDICSGRRNVGLKEKHREVINTPGDAVTFDLAWRLPTQHQRKSTAVMERGMKSTSDPDAGRQDEESDAERTNTSAVMA